VSIRKSAVVVILLGILAGSAGTSLAATGNGPCAKAGATVTVSGLTYKCSLIWIVQNPTPAKTFKSSTTRSIVFSGQGGLNEQTSSQRLSGNYSIRWQTFGSCSYYANLSDSNNSDLFDADGAIKGKNTIHNIPSGNYYITVTTGPPPDCSWKAVFTSIK